MMQHRRNLSKCVGLRQGRNYSTFDIFPSRRDAPLIAHAFMRGKWKKDFETEFKSFLTRHHIDYDDRYVLG